MRASEMSEVVEEEKGRGEALHFKICMAGCSGAGKTKLITRYRTNTYQDEGTITLVVDHVPIKKTIGKINYVFDYYDTAGQERYRSCVNLYFRDCHAVIFVYDVTKQQTLTELKEFIGLVEEASPSALKIIVGTKNDLGSTVNEALLEQYKNLGIKTYKASSKTGENVR